MFQTKRLLWMAGGGVLTLAIVGGGAAGIAAATGAGGDDNEVAITGTALEQASAAALAHTSGGRVTQTEVGDEGSLYEVEVTLDDGSQVDVQLDADFNVVGDKVDAEGADDSDGE